MKKIFFFLFFILVTQFSHAQINYKITYKEISVNPYSVEYDWGEKGVPEVILRLREQRKSSNPDHIYQSISEYLLLFQGNISSFTNINNQIVNHKGETPPDGRQPSALSHNIIYKNWNANKLLATTEEGFVWQSNTNSFDWAIHYDEQIDYLGYKLTKATSTYYNDKKIIAWFAEELPIPEGPSFLNGLPGLILKCRIGNFIYKAKDIQVIKNGTEVIDLPETTSTLKTYKEWKDAIRGN